MDQLSVAIRAFYVGLAEVGLIVVYQDGSLLYIPTGEMASETSIVRDNGFGPLITACKISHRAAQSGEMGREHAEASWLRVAVEALNLLGGVSCPLPGFDRRAHYVASAAKGGRSRVNVAGDKEDKESGNCDYDSKQGVTSCHLTSLIFRAIRSFYENRPDKKTGQTADFYRYSLLHLHTNPFTLETNSEGRSLQASESVLTQGQVSEGT